jgi:hypothetical protein
VHYQTIIKDRQYALICTTPLLYVLAPTRFGCSLPSSGSLLDPPELLEIQIEWAVYHIMCGYVTCVPDCRERSTGISYMKYVNGRLKWTEYILRRNCLLRQVIERKTKEGMGVKGRRGRWCRKLLDDLRERRGYSNLKEEALDRIMWRACIGRGFGSVVRQSNKWMKTSSLG